MPQEWNSEAYAHNAAYVSELGLPVVTLLEPKFGEHILDLGCGEGTLAKTLGELGCKVVGVDASAEMVAAAKAQGVDALCLSGEALTFDQEFDAVFSNAALHWMTQYRDVLVGVNRALKPYGRFVAEFGGAGNIHHIRDAMVAVFQQNPHLGSYRSPWFFPSESQYKALLEEHGFVVDSIEIIHRPTRLEAGMREWLKLFAEHATSTMNEDAKNEFLDKVEAKVKPMLFDEHQGWYADYVRLRFVARKMNHC